MVVGFFHLPKKRTAQFVVSVLLSLAFLVPKHAVAQAAISFDPTPFYSLSTGQGVYGWQFTANSALEVSALGLFDNAGIFDGGFPGDGFVDAHPIAIWDVANPSNPLATTTIPSGTGAPLVNGFRYVSVNSVVLPAGHDFVIAALYASANLTNEDWLVGSPNNAGFKMSTGPGVQFGGYRYNNSTALGFPNFYGPGQEFAFGPNFTYTVVPEPSSVAICGLVTVMAFLRARIRVRKHARLI